MKQDAQGKLVIISIFGVAIAMSVYAWWHNIHTGNQVIEFFGIETATRLRHAESIELLTLDKSAASEDQESLDTSIGSIPVRTVTDITSARGLVHLRHMFIQDHTYRWDEGVPEIIPQWSFALRFTDDAGTTTLAFAPSTYVVEDLESGKVILMGDLLDNLIRYLTENKLLTIDEVTSS